MSEINKVSQKLLAEGWTQDQTPPGMKPWDSFYGGWTYRPDARRGVVFESPCGLLWQRSEISYSGTMYFMGISWTEENDLITAFCPHYERTERCELNHPVLEASEIAGCHYEKLCYCALHETDKAWDYEHSAKRVEDEAEKRKGDRWEAFRKSRGGRVCIHHSRYNRHTGEWTMTYDPQHNCHCGSGAFCPVLGKTLSEDHGNVFFDRKLTWTVKGDGFLPDEQKSSVTRGVKLLKKATSMTICEVIAKTCREDLEWTERMNRHTDITFGKLDSVEVLNIRAESKAGRDLQEDLQLISEGVEIVHASDLDAKSKAQNHEKRESAKFNRRRQMEKLLRGKGWSALNEYERRRVRKLLESEEIRQIEAERHDRESGIGVNISLFEE